MWRINILYGNVVGVTVEHDPNFSVGGARI